MKQNLNAHILAGNQGLDLVGTVRKQRTATHSEQPGLDGLGSLMEDLSSVFIIYIWTGKGG